MFGKLKTINVPDNYEFREDDVDMLRQEYDVLKYKGKLYDLRTGEGNLVELKDFP